MKRVLGLALFILAFHDTGSAARSAATKPLSDRDRAIAFAVQQEVLANSLDNRDDVCLGFGHGLQVDEKGIISELYRYNLKLHPNDWCNRGPRGYVVSVIPPVDGSTLTTYKFVIELGSLDSIRQEGEHFGTLLRRGIYVVQVEKGGEPKLVSYRKTCCPEQPNPTGD